MSTRSPRPPAPPPIRPEPAVRRPVPTAAQARPAGAAPSRPLAPHVQAALAAARPASPAQARPAPQATARPASHVQAALAQTARQAPAVQPRRNPAAAPPRPGVVQRARPPAPRPPQPARGVIQRASEDMDLTTEDVKNHFLQAFKTVLTAEMETQEPYSPSGKIVRTQIGKFYSIGGPHAEEHLLAHLDAHWSEWEGWELVRQDRSEIRITIVINNSPCGTDDHDCAGQLKRWAEDKQLNDYNVRLTIQAANIYKKNTQASLSGLQDLQEDGHMIDWFSAEQLMSQHGLSSQGIARQQKYVGNMKKKLQDTQDFIDENEL